MTARRASIAEDAPFIIAQAAKGVPVGAIARMIGRNPADVGLIVNAPPLLAVERHSKTPKPPRTTYAKPKPKIRHRKVRRQGPRALTPAARTAIEAVANYYGVTLEEVIGKRGGRAIQPIRREAYHAVYSLRRPDGSRRYTSTCVGLFFGGRDHSTILSGVAAHLASLAEAQGRAA